MGSRFSVFTRFWEFLRRIFRCLRKRSEPKRKDDDVPLPDVTKVSEPDAQLAAPPTESNHEKGNCIETVRQGDSFHNAEAYGIDNLIIGLSPPHKRAGSTSSFSGDESDDPTKVSARKQLSSIPEPDESERGSPEIGYQGPPPAEPPTKPIQLSDLIERVGPHSVLNCLRIEDVLAAGKVNRQLRTTVDNYFHHYVLPQTEVVCYVDHIFDDLSPPSEEHQRLYPVIRRIDKEKRVFPDKRVVYEPKIETSKYTYRKDSFNHVEVKFHLGDSRQPKKWPLDYPPEPPKVYSYKADGNRTKKLTFQPTRMFQFLRFDTFKNSPIYVFYKDVPDTGGDIVKLHAISIPLNFLRQSLSARE